MTCSFRFLAGEPGAVAGRGVSQLPGPTCIAPEPLCPAIWSPTAGLVIDRMASLETRLPLLLNSLDPSYITITA